jgi:plasmid maintenance system antidote protein VapI
VVVVFGSMIARADMCNGICGCAHCQQSKHSAEGWEHHRANKHFVLHTITLNTLLKHMESITTVTALRITHTFVTILQDLWHLRLSSQIVVSSRSTRLAMHDEVEKTNF